MINRSRGHRAHARHARVGGHPGPGPRRGLPGQGPGAGGRAVAERAWCSLAGAVLFLHTALHGTLVALPSVVETLGALAAAGTLYGALSAGAGSATLLPVVALPAFAPLLIAGERSFAAALDGGALWQWWVIVDGGARRLPGGRDSPLRCPGGIVMKVLAHRLLGPVTLVALAAHRVAGPGGHARPTASRATWRAWSTCTRRWPGSRSTSPSARRPSPARCTCGRARARSSMDRVAHCAMEVSVVFIVLTLITGSIWGRPTWGVWWAWDARLTSTAILGVLALGYLALRRANDDPDAARAPRRGLRAAGGDQRARSSTSRCSGGRPCTRTRPSSRADRTLLIHGIMAWTLLLSFVAFTLRLRVAAARALPPRGGARAWRRAGRSSARSTSAAARGRSDGLRRRGVRVRPRGTGALRAVDLVARTP